MKNILEEYGPVILRVLSIICLIAIISFMVAGGQNSLVGGYFTDTLDEFNEKVTFNINDLLYNEDGSLSETGIKLGNCEAGGQHNFFVFDNLDDEAKHKFMDKYGFGSEWEFESSDAQVICTNCGTVCTNYDADIPELKQDKENWTGECPTCDGLQWSGQCNYCDHNKYDYPDCSHDSIMYNIINGTLYGLCWDCEYMFKA